MKLLVLAALMAATGATPAPPPTSGATVHIRGFAYVPATLTVAAGSVVRFVNDDGEAHTVTATNHSFDSAGLDTGDAWSHRFATPGTYAYFCELHPYMKGTVVVRSAGASQ